MRRPAVAVEETAAPAMPRRRAVGARESFGEGIG
jgi:hypothetical protein